MEATDYRKINSLYDGKGAILLPSQSIPTSQALSDEAKIWLDSLYSKIFVYDSDVEKVSLSANEFLIYTDYLKKEFQTEQEKLIELSDVTIEVESIAGVLVDFISSKKNQPREGKNRLVIYLNDCETLLDLSLLTGAVYLAAESDIRVAVPRRQKTTEQPLLDQLQNLFSVYTTIMSRFSAESTAFVGEAKGAELCASLVVMSFQQGIEIPAALALIGIEGTTGDSNYQNRNLNLTNLRRLATQHLHKDTLLLEKKRDEIGFDDPVLFPVNANMEMFPRTILFAGTRDENYSSTTVFHRELRRAGIKASLNIYDGLPQFYHAKISLPEAQDTYTKIGQFLDSSLA